MYTSLFLTLLAVLCIGSGYTAAQAVAGVGIYEAKPNLVIGSLYYTGGSSPTPQITLPNNYYGPSGAQLSTYNYKTNILTMMAMKPNYGGTFYNINCTGQKWTTEVGHSYTFQAAFTGLTSDQGPNNGVFATYSRPESNQKDLLYVGYLLDLQMAISTYFVGSFRGSIYLPNNQTFFVAFRNDSGLYMKAYDETVEDLYEVPIGFANNKYPIVDTPLNFVWDSSINTIIATVQMTNTNNQPTYALAFYDPVTYNFVISKMYGYGGDTFYSTTYLGGKNAYTFASGPSNNVLYTWDFNTGSFVSTRPYNTQILAAF